MTPYSLLPFRFERYDDKEYLLTNEIGEYVFMSIDDFNKFTSHQLDTNSDIFLELQSKQIATTDKVEDVIKMLATKYRTKKSILRDFTTLHMVFLLYVVIPVAYTAKLLVKIWTLTL